MKGGDFPVEGAGARGALIMQLLTESLSPVYRFNSIRFLLLIVKIGKSLDNDDSCQAAQRDDNAMQSSHQF